MSAGSENNGFRVKKELCKKVPAAHAENDSNVTDELGTASKFTFIGIIGKSPIARNILQEF